jgi:hypothetical protein
MGIVLLARFRQPGKLSAALAGNTVGLADMGAEINFPLASN